MPPPARRRRRRIRFSPCRNGQESTALATATGVAPYDSMRAVAILSCGGFLVRDAVALYSTRPTKEPFASQKFWSLVLTSRFFGEARASQRNGFTNKRKREIVSK